MENYKEIKKLIKIANVLDKNRLFKEADIIDSVLLKLSAEDGKKTFSLKVHPLTAIVALLGDEDPGLSNLLRALVDDDSETEEELGDLLKELQGEDSKETDT